MYGIALRCLPHLAAQATRGICATRPLLKSKPEMSGLANKLKFKFDEENIKRVNVILSSHPEQEKRAALLPLLDLAQRQYGWLPISAIIAVAELLKLDPFVVWEVAKFYGMYNLKPVGAHLVNVCTSTLCYLRDCEKLVKVAQSVLNLELGETSKDMKFTLRDTYCMGCCVNAPVVSINDDIYEDLTEYDFEHILCDLKNGKIPAAGPCSGRFASEPKCGLTSLTTEPPPPGYMMQDLRKK